VQPAAIDQLIELQQCNPLTNVILALLDSTQMPAASSPALLQHHGCAALYMLVRFERLRQLSLRVLCGSDTHTEKDLASTHQLRRPQRTC